MGVVDIRYRDTWFPLNKLSKEERQEVLRQFEELQEPIGSIKIGDRWTPTSDLTTQQFEQLKNKVGKILSDGIRQQVSIIHQRKAAAL